MKAKKIWAILLSLAVLIGVMPMAGLMIGAAEDTVKTVYVSASGDDAAAGTEAAPFASLSAAMAAIIAEQDSYEAGEIVILDSATASSTGAFGTVEWAIPVTVKGSSSANTLTLSSKLYLYGDTTFDNLALVTGGERHIYAQHHAVTIGSGVTTAVSGTPWLADRPCGG